MPIVGMVIALGDEGGDRWRDRLQHDGEAAGSLERARRVDQAARLDGGTALRFVPAQQLHRLRRQPDVADHRNRGIDDRFGTPEHRPRAFQLHRVGPSLLQKPDGVPNGGLVRRLKRSERHVGDDERPSGAARDGASQHEHFVHGDRQRRVVPEHGHGGGIADERDVDAGGVGEPGARRVIHRHHRDSLAAALHRAEIRD